MVEHRVQVGDRTLVADATATGDKLVVFETGLGAPSEWWQDVQRLLDPSVSSWRYDRAGRGHSDPAPTPRTPEDLLRDLDAVVLAAGGKQVVLVGNSLGGMLVRLYAHQNPERVAGLVLVDASHEDQFERIGRLLPPASMVPPEGQEFHAFWARGGWRDPTQNPETIDFLAMKHSLDTIDSLHDMPLVVLASGTFLQAPPPPLRRPLHQEWISMQGELASLSGRSRLVLVEDSGHFIQHDRPQVVADAVAEVLLAMEHR